MQEADNSTYHQVKKRCQDVKTLIIPPIAAIISCVFTFSFLSIIINHQLTLYTKNPGDVQRLWTSQGMGEDSLGRSIGFLEKLLRVVEIHLYLNLAVAAIAAALLCLIKSELLDVVKMNNMACGIFAFLNIEKLHKAILYTAKADILTAATVAVSVLAIVFATRKRLGNMGLILCIVYSLPIVALVADVCVSNGQSFIRSTMVRMCEYDNVNKKLYRKITALAERHGLTEENIYIEKSLHMNAYAMSGLRYRFLSIYSKMFEALDEDQLLSVVAHELGHIVRHDSLVLGVLLVITGLILLSIGGTTYLLLRKNYSKVSMLLIAFYLMNLSELLCGLMINRFFRHSCEFRADENACKSSYGSNLAEALRIMTMVGRQGKMFDYERAFGSLLSHPAIYRRIQAIGYYLDTH